jgi:hypothetical protein
MFFLFIISVVVARKVKIISTEKPSNVLTLLPSQRGGLVRLMDEANVAKPEDQSIFDISGDETAIDNKGNAVCATLLGSGVVTCQRWISKTTTFRVLNVGSNVKFQTGSRCLTRAGFDSATNGYYLNLRKCADIPEQLFKMLDISTGEDVKPSTLSSAVPEPVLPSPLVSDPVVANSLLPESALPRPALPEPVLPKSDLTPYPDSIREGLRNTLSGGSDPLSRSATSEFSQRRMQSVIRSTREGSTGYPRDLDDRATGLMSDKLFDNYLARQRSERRFSSTLDSPLSSSFSSVRRTSRTTSSSLSPEKEFSHAEFMSRFKDNE